MLAVLVDLPDTFTYIFKIASLAWDNLMIALISPIDAYTGVSNYSAIVLNGR